MGRSIRSSIGMLVLLVINLISVLFIQNNIAGSMQPLYFGCLGVVDFTIVTVWIMDFTRGLN